MNKCRCFSCGMRDKKKLEAKAAKLLTGFYSLEKPDPNKLYELMSV